LTEVQKQWLTATAMVISSVFLAAPASADEPLHSPEAFLVPVMSISTVGNLTDVQAGKIMAGAAASGAKGYELKFPTIGLTAHSRGSKDLMRLAEGWRIPMATMVAPVEYIRTIAGPNLAAVLSRGQVALGRNSATLRDASVGDVLTLRDGRFNRVSFIIGAIVAEPFVNYGDMLMSSETAARLGKMPTSRVSIVNIVSPAKVISGLKKKRISIGTQFRLRTTWDLPNPDGTLGLGEVKALVGEYAYKPGGGSSILIDRKWSIRSMSWGYRYKDIGLKNNCLTVAVKAIQGALTEIKAKGLAHTVDIKNSNRFGGCFVGRYNRLSRSFPSPSRHAWGMSLDINTIQNPQGGVPLMNCDVVRIFRKWGFAWGGNFWPADGMHFEYVGQRRDELGYPSTYCRNSVPIPTRSIPSFEGPPPTSTTTTTLLVVDPDSTTTTTTLIP